MTLPAEPRARLRPRRRRTTRGRPLSEHVPALALRQRRSRPSRTTTTATATPFTPSAGPQRRDRQGRATSITSSSRPTKGQTFDVRVFARSLRSPLDSVLYVGKRSGGAIAGNDDSAGPDSYLRFTAPEDGEYVVWVQDQLLKGGPDYAYRIEVSPVEPSSTLSVPNESLDPRDGHDRRGGPQGEPAGDPGQCQPRRLRRRPRHRRRGAPRRGDVRGRHDGRQPRRPIPVLFTAKAERPVAGALATLSGKPVDPKVERALASSARWSSWSSARTTSPFWTRTVDRLAVAVTEEAPYSIEVVEPKVPLVRGGSMDLKVVAKRKAGFTAPIAVSLPWNPPGIGSAGGVAIPEKQNEAVIPLNADGGAELKTWKIVVNGSSDGPTGPLTVSSQLAKLTVAAPFVGLRRTRPASRRAGQGGRPGRQGDQGGRLRRRGAR